MFSACPEHSSPITHPTSTVSRIKPREILHRRHVFHTRCFLHYSKVRFPKYCGKRALKAQKRAEKCPRIASLNVGAILQSSMTFKVLYIQSSIYQSSIYPVLVVARTGSPCEPKSLDVVLNIATVNNYLETENALNEINVINVLFIGFIKFDTKQ